MMEIYKVNRNDWKESIISARKVSVFTGASFVYHWIDCLYCNIRYGCSPLQYYEGGFYKLRSFDRKEAYTKGRIRKAVARYNERRCRYLLNNKIEFNKLFADFVKRQWIDCRTASVSEIEEFVNKTGHCFIKPIADSKGNGIQRCHKEDAHALSIEYSGKDFILEEQISQHPMMCYNNESVNTLRMMTVMDKSGEVHLLKVGLRCGIGDSLVDNFCAGGVIYPVDLKHGKISGPGVTKSFGEQVYVHPGTDIYMLGRDIPYWLQTVDFVKQAAKRLPHLRFVGWDVAITNDGPILIEGNSRPGVVFDPVNLRHGLYMEIMSY